MHRRRILKAGLTGLAASAVASPAIAQSSPNISWRSVSGFPKSLDVLFGSAETVAKYVGEATDGKFKIQTFAAGEIIPGLQVVDSVSNGTVEMGSTALFFSHGKDPVFSLATSMPFLLNARSMTAWLMEGGGDKMLGDFLAKFNLVRISSGNNLMNMGGWFRKEINTLADLKGLKFRIGGFAGEVFARVGGVPQVIAPGDIYPSLERGTIDGVEFVCPYDDEKLGFNKVAKYYYFPGWHDGGANIDVIINNASWAALPKHYQAALRTACSYAHQEMISRYDARNTAALRRLVGSGTELRSFSPEILAGLHKAAFEQYAETAQKNATFKTIMQSMVDFRRDFYQYYRISDYAFDSMVMSLMGSEPKSI